MSAAVTGLLLDRPIEEFLPAGEGHMVNRLRNSLLRGGIATVGELVRRTPADLTDIRNFGVGQLAEVRRRLAGWGLALSGDEEATS